MPTLIILLINSSLPSSPRHLINTHHEKIDARLCEHCGHRSKNRQDLYHHIQVAHKIMPPQGVAFPVCKICKYVAVDKSALTQHELDKGHGPAAAAAAETPTAKVTRSRATGKAAEVEIIAKAKPTSTTANAPEELPCLQCDKTFMNRKALTMHTVVKHRRPKARAKTYEEDEDEDEDDEEDESDADEVDFDSALQEDVDYVPNKSIDSGKKVKVLSHVTMKGVKARSSEAESLTRVATGIATSLRLGSSADHSAELDYSQVGIPSRLIDKEN